MDMDLKKYLKINNLSYRDFAGKLNDKKKRELMNLPLFPISWSSIYRWSVKKCKPNLKYMKIIQTMTHGKVTMKDFLGDN
jgi:hypothetical protein